MSEYCAECGALLPEGSTCQTIFEEFLCLEYTYNVYAQVHFLTVACFMLQHGRYSDEALLGIRMLLQDYLEKQLTPQQLRTQAKNGMRDPARTWKITRRANEPPLPKVAWSMTIADVARSKQDPEQYCAHIKQWAQVTLQEMPALFH